MLIFLLLKKQLLSILLSLGVKKTLPYGLDQLVTVGEQQMIL